eukprot:scaffold63924_cov62-Phaeocystis_antarctica.AAC.5
MAPWRSLARARAVGGVQRQAVEDSRDITGHRMDKVKQRLRFSRATYLAAHRCAISRLVHFAIHSWSERGGRAPVCDSPPFLKCCPDTGSADAEGDYHGSIRSLIGADRRRHQHRRDPFCARRHGDGLRGLGALDAHKLARAHAYMVKGGETGGFGDRWLEHSK